MLRLPYRPLPVLSWCLLLAALPAFGQLQSGRDAKGTLWISDQGLPAGVKARAPDSTPVMRLPSGAATSGTNHSAADALSADTSRGAAAKAAQNGATQNGTTCNNIGQRYAEARTSLEKTERDQAAGRLLIADAGLVTMRQNLATLARLQELCR